MLESYLVYGLEVDGLVFFSVIARREGGWSCVNTNVQYRGVGENKASALHGGRQATVFWFC